MIMMLIQGVGTTVIEISESADKNLPPAMDPSPPAAQLPTSAVCCINVLTAKMIITELSLLVSVFGTSSAMMM